MTEHQKPQHDAATVSSDVEAGNTEQATASLAQAVAKRNEARKASDRGAGRGSHGGKPVSTLKVSSQVQRQTVAPQQSAGLLAGGGGQAQPWQRRQQRRPVFIDGKRDRAMVVLHPTALRIGRVDPAWAP